MLDPIWQPSAGSASSTRWTSWKKNPTRVLVTAAWADSPRVSWTRWPRSAFRVSVPACATSTGFSNSPCATAGNANSPTTGSARPDPWEVASPTRRSSCGSPVHSTFTVGRCDRSTGGPSTLIGLPYDRPGGWLRRAHQSIRFACGRLRRRTTSTSSSSAAAISSEPWPKRSPPRH